MILVIIAALPVSRVRGGTANRSEWETVPPRQPVAELTDRPPACPRSSRGLVPRVGTDTPSRGHSLHHHRAPKRRHCRDWDLGPTAIPTARVLTSEKLLPEMTKKNPTNHHNDCGPKSFAEGTNGNHGAAPRLRERFRFWKGRTGHRRGRGSTSPVPPPPAGPEPPRRAGGSRSGSVRPHQCSVPLPSAPHPRGEARQSWGGRSTRVRDARWARGPPDSAPSHHLPIARPPPFLARRPLAPEPAPAPFVPFPTLAYTLVCIKYLHYSSHVGLRCEHGSRRRSRLGGMQRGSARPGPARPLPRPLSAPQHGNLQPYR